MSPLDNTSVFTAPMNCVCNTLDTLVIILSSDDTLRRLFHSQCIVCPCGVEVILKLHVISKGPYQLNIALFTHLILIMHKAVNRIWEVNAFHLPTIYTVINEQYIICFKRST